eukprot:11175301-Lingulodinium_polyedra.AAC.1
MLRAAVIARFCHQLPTRALAQYVQIRKQPQFGAGSRQPKSTPTEFTNQMAIAAMHNILYAR